ncbi:MAG: phage tail sheath protein, partial [Oscillospiraceae bacterium]|nr:phage tail sheath protein [Oscillospiraceae bacterium]
MAGGTFTARNKVRPGAYINFTSAPGVMGTIGERGTALLPLRLPFGPEGVLTAVTADTDVRLVFGLTSEDDRLLLLRECAKRAGKVLVWRLGGGEKASCTNGALTVTARWGGSGGNGITVVIRGSAPFAVETWICGALAHSQTASTAE